MTNKRYLQKCNLKSMKLSQIGLKKVLFYLISLKVQRLTPSVDDIEVNVPATCQPTLEGD